jgi:hypothetical protein
MIIKCRMCKLDGFAGMDGLCDRCWQDIIE